MDEETRTELKDHAEKLTDHAEKLASLLGLKEQITLVSTALNSQCTTLTTITTQLAVLVAELPHIAEREDSKIQKHYLDCTIKEDGKSVKANNPNGNKSRLLDIAVSGKKEFFWAVIFIVGTLLLGINIMLKLFGPFKP